MLGIASFFGSIWAKVAVIGAIVLAIMLILMGFHSKGEVAGRRAMEIETNRRARKVKDAQIDAVRNRPRTDDDLDRILRDGTF